CKISGRSKLEKGERDNQVLAALMGKASQNRNVLDVMNEILAAHFDKTEFFNRIDRAPPAAAPLNRSFPIPCSPS
ncbi:MAG: hypothetical protein ABI379_13445, partial [Rhodanobacter sp.]